MLSKPLQDFLRERIEAFEQLEALSLLRADPAEARSAHAVAETLRITEPLAEAALEHLCAQELLVAEGTPTRSYRYAPAGVTIADHASQAVDAYRDARLEVLAFVSQCAMERIRYAHVRAFAQAFLLRGPNQKDRK